MVDFNQLIELLKTDEFRNSQFAESGEKNILFICPDLSGGNIYKMILPYLHLAETGVIATAMLGLHKFNPVERYKHREEVAILPREMYWANTVVFPFTAISLHESFRHIRQFNPHANLVLHVDFDFTSLPVGHLYEGIFNDPRILNQIYHNLKLADTVIVANNLLGKTIIKRMREQGIEIDPRKFQTMVLSTSPKYLFDVEGADRDKLYKVEYRVVEKVKTETEELGIELDVPEEEDFFKDDDLPPIEEPFYIRRRNKEFTLGLIISDTQVPDLESVLPDLVEISKKYKEALKIVLIGANIKNPAFKKTKALLKHAFIKDENLQALSGSIGNFRFEKPVPIWKYYDLIAEINPDAILIPSCKSNFSIVSNDYKRYLDAALLKIPCICQKVDPYDKIIQPGKNGYLYEDKKGLADIFSSVIPNRDILEAVGEGAHETMIQNFIFDDASMQDIVTMLA